MKSGKNTQAWQCGIWHWLLQPAPFRRRLEWLFLEWHFNRSGILIGIFIGILVFFLEWHFNRSGYGCCTCYIHSIGHLYTFNPSIEDISQTLLWCLPWVFLGPQSARKLSAPPCLSVRCATLPRQRSFCQTSASFRIRCIDKDKDKMRNQGTQPAPVWSDAYPFSGASRPGSPH